MRRLFYIGLLTLLVWAGALIVIRYTSIKPNHQVVEPGRSAQPVETMPVPGAVPH